jgi:lipopolysaccharide biosynthesis regulator YciM
MSDTPSTPETVALMATLAAIRKAASNDPEAARAALLVQRVRFEKGIAALLFAAIRELQQYMEDPTRTHDLQKAYHSVYGMEEAIHALRMLQDFHNPEGAV